MRKKTNSEHEDIQLERAAALSDILTQPLVVIHLSQHHDGRFYFMNNQEQNIGNPYITNPTEF